MIIERLIIILVLFTILYYTIAKERQELGCSKISIERQCNDENSVYLKDTKLSSTDTCRDMKQKLISILSYHEKGAVWRRCLIISFITVGYIYIVYNIDNSLKTPYHYIVLLLVIFCIMYFYHNYINYHHFRNLKKNGVEILEEISRKCYKIMENFL
jgi:hypothetical protein